MMEVNAALNDDHGGDHGVMMHLMMMINEASPRFKKKEQKMRTRGNL